MLVHPVQHHGIDKWIQRALIAAVSITVLLILIPLSSIALSVLRAGESEYWSYFPTDEAPRLLGHTFYLSFWVWLVTIIMGFSVAFLTTFVQFTGRSLVVLLALIPFTIPSYVMGFVWLDLTAKLQGMGINFGGLNAMNGLFGLVWSMSLSLFPYVFIAARIVMRRFDPQLLDAARNLGHNKLHMVRKIIFPLAIPALLAATFVVISEVSADIGTVSIFAYDTLTTAIFKAWYGFFSPHDALKIASILVSICFGLFLLIELINQDRRRLHTNVTTMPACSPASAASNTLSLLMGSHHQPFLTPKPRYQHLLGGILMGVMACGSLIPLGGLVNLATTATMNQGTINTLQTILVQTCWLGGGVAAVVILLALIHLFALRILQSGHALAQHHNLFTRMKPPLSRLSIPLIHLPILGHTIPGAVMAVSLYLPFYYIGELIGVPITTMICTLFIALSLHFYGVAHQTLTTPFRALPNQLDESALSLNSTHSGLFTQIHLPLLTTPMLMSGLLVFMDVIKELPLTLMLRPLGWSTLAVKVYEWTAEGEWEKAAVPALGIVVMCAGCALILGILPKLTSLKNLLVSTLFPTALKLSA